MPTVEELQKILDAYKSADKTTPLMLSLSPDVPSAGSIELTPTIATNISTALRDIKASGLPSAALNFTDASGKTTSGIVTNNIPQAIPITPPSPIPPSPASTYVPQLVTAGTAVADKNKQLMATYGANIADPNSQITTLGALNRKGQDDVVKAMANLANVRDKYVVDAAGNRVMNEDGTPQEKNILSKLYDYTLGTAVAQRDLNIANADVVRSITPSMNNAAFLEAYQKLQANTEPTTTLTKAVDAEQAAATLQAKILEANQTASGNYNSAIVNATNAATNQQQTANSGNYQDKMSEIADKDAESKRIQALAQAQEVATRAAVAGGGSVINNATMEDWKRAASVLGVNLPAGDTVKDVVNAIPKDQKVIMSNVIANNFQLGSDPYTATQNALTTPNISPDVIASAMTNQQFINEVLASPTAQKQLMTVVPKGVDINNAASMVLLTDAQRAMIEGAKRAIVNNAFNQAATGDLAGSYKFNPYAQPAIDKLSTFPEFPKGLDAVSVKKPIQDVMALAVSSGATSTEISKFFSGISSTSLAARAGNLQAFGLKPATAPKFVVKYPGIDKPVDLTNQAQVEQVMAFQKATQAKQDTLSSYLTTGMPYP